MSLTLNLISELSHHHYVIDHCGRPATVAGEAINHFNQSCRYMSTYIHSYIVRLLYQTLTLTLIEFLIALLYICQNQKYPCAYFILKPAMALVQVFRGMNVIIFNRRAVPKGAQHKERLTDVSWITRAALNSVQFSLCCRC